MKKVIPQKIANIVYGKLLAGKRREKDRKNWRENTFYKSTDSYEISNKFFKNKVTRFIYKCHCDWCIDGKLASTTKRIEKLKEDLNDYLQEQL